MLKIVGVKFQEWGKVYHYASQDLALADSDPVIIETDDGLGLGSVKLLPGGPDGEKRPERLKKVLRKANDEDLMQQERNREKENAAFAYCREKIEELKLNMKLVNVDYLFDGSKATFHFTAEERIDFRELVKDLAGRFHTRIELRQIGVRDGARIKGGIGPCGRRLCCSTWINEFEPVSVKMAKAQNLSLNPANISGMCGRLMCCLAYEYQNYVSGEMARAAAARIREQGEKREEASPSIEPVREKSETMPQPKKREKNNTHVEDREAAKDRRPAGKRKRDWKRFKKKKGAKEEGSKN